MDIEALAAELRREAKALGFAACSITGVDLGEAEARLQQWLAANRHGEMDYMARHGLKRARPAELVPGTLRVISLRMDYWPGGEPPASILEQPALAYISRYALGRDYHKVLRARLQTLVERIRARVPAATRVFVDSAPVLEVELAQRGGLGWRGKHGLLIDRGAGSYFFLGEIFIDLPLPMDTLSSTGHCGSCTACFAACPTDAIIAPYQVDARRCISYLTIEHPGAIPEPLRALIGNRIYGCDDCQLCCPWNRFASLSIEADFAVRHGLDRATLAELFPWNEETFRERMAGSAIYRIGHERWLRNIAVALGNAPGSTEVLAALRARKHDASELVRVHVAWALHRHAERGG
ncbi:epoxyqueuosine reductase [Betaproteobacteria bacterium]|nr:epoxyqueuosine reductase [Betaproteobacteria bacterium]GHU16251.1 epoxyqueuosine reductase [Betaproteobacteria bacterium]